MANWNSSELQLPQQFNAIAKNAKNAISSVNQVMEIVGKVGAVAEFYLMLSNPAGTIIRIAAEEIIKLCNDFKEIGVFFLLINPMEKQYANLNPARYGLKIKQDAKGNYLFVPSKAPSTPDAFSSVRADIEVDADYQKTLLLKDLVNYRDPFDRKQGTLGFIPPTPIFDETLEWELGGYDPATWTGELPTTPKLTNGIFPPQMTPSQVLRVMSEAFDDEGDVSIYGISSKDSTYSGKLFTASGAAATPSRPLGVQSERLFRDPLTESNHHGTRTLELGERREITTLISSGKPNFSGSSNIQGIETIAIVALVGVSSFDQFINSWKSLEGLFGGAPDLSNMVKELNAVKFAADEVGGKDRLSLTNNTKYGEWESGDFIKGETSGASGKISKIVKTQSQAKTRTELKTIYDADNIAIARYPVLIDVNPDQHWKRVDILYKKFGNINFQAGEKVYEAVQVPDKESQRNLFAGKLPPEYPITSNIIKKEKTGSALGTIINARDVNPNDVPKYGEILGIDTSAPESIHPNFSSIKIKDMIPGYAGFFDVIIQFAEGLKSFADGADTQIAILLEMIKKYIAYFQDIANQIKAFLSIFTNLPTGGVYWLTIKTYGGNKAIQAAIAGSDDQPSDDLKFCAGFAMVSVSGVGGLSATRGLESLFSGLGLKFQEVAMIPEVTELDTAVLSLSNQYKAANAAAEALAKDIGDVLGLNPPVTFRDATTITFTGWNGVEPNVGDYVLGTKSGAFGQILSFGGEELVLDHIEPGPTLTGIQVPEERIVRLFDVTSGDFLEFPYAGKLVGTNGLAFDGAPDTTLTLVGEGRFSEKVLVTRSSHKPNGQGTTVYEVFQGNEGTFVKVDDVEEFVEEQEIILPANLPWNTFGQDRIVKQQVFKVVNGSVKDPVLESGHNGKYGSFTDDDTIISFGEEFAQTFLADIEGRNAEDDKVTRLKPPPQPDHDDTYGMKITVAGTGSISVTAEGGEVESYAVALDNKLNPNNLPESAAERTARERANN